MGVGRPLPDWQPLHLLSCRSSGSRSLVKLKQCPPFLSTASPLGCFRWKIMSPLWVTYWWQNFAVFHHFWHMVYNDRCFGLIYLKHSPSGVSPLKWKHPLLGCHLADQSSAGCPRASVSSITKGLAPVGPSQLGHWLLWFWGLLPLQHHFASYSPRKDLNG